MLVDAFVRPTQRWITGGISLVASLLARSPPSGSGRLVLAARRGCVQRNDRARRASPRLHAHLPARVRFDGVAFDCLGWKREFAGGRISLTLIAHVGMMLMASGNDLVIIFLGLEILSIATYVMAGFRRTDIRSNESSLKYSFSVRSRPRFYSTASRSSTAPHRLPSLTGRLTQQDCRRHHQHRGDCHAH